MVAGASCLIAAAVNVALTTMALAQASLLDNGAWLLVVLLMMTALALLVGGASLCRSGWRRWRDRPRD